MINLQKLIKSFQYAFEGIFYAVRNNQNFRIHFSLALIVIVLGYVFRINLAEWSILAIVIILVFALEMFNVAIEEIVDLITTDYRKEAEIAKDVGAGMVLVAAIGATIVGVFIFLPHILIVLK